MEERKIPASTDKPSTAILSIQEVIDLLNKFALLSNAQDHVKEIIAQFNKFSELSGPDVAKLSTHLNKLVANTDLSEIKIETPPLTLNDALYQAAITLADNRPAGYCADKDFADFEVLNRDDKNRIVLSNRLQCRIESLVGAINSIGYQDPVTHAKLSSRDIKRIQNKVDEYNEAATEAKQGTLTITASAVAQAEDDPRMLQSAVNIAQRSLEEKPQILRGFLPLYGMFSSGRARLSPKDELLSEMKNAGMTTEIINNWQPPEGGSFGAQQKNAVIFLMTEKEYKPLEAIQEINGLNHDEAFLLQNYYDQGLRGNHIRNWVSPADDFFMSRLDTKAVIDLTENHNVTPSQAIEELNQLSSDQVVLLQDCFSYELRGSHLRSWQHPEGDTLFGAGHASAVKYFITELLLPPAEAIQRINGLTDDAAKQLVPQVTASP